MPVANIGSSAYELDWDIAQTSQNVGANTSQVYGRLILRKKSGSGYWSYSTNSWSASIDGQNFSGNFTYDFRNYSELMLWQGTVTIGHNADGTKTVASSAYAAISAPSGNATVYRTLPLSTIPRASQPSISGSVVTGNTVTINTNRLSSAFMHLVRWSFGSMSGTVAGDVATSVNWTIPHNLLTQIPNAASGVGYIYLDTFNAGTLIGTKSVNFTLTAGADQIPTLTGATIAEAVTSPVDIASVIGGYVQSQSKLSYSITGAAGIQGSSIASYSFKVGSVTSTAVSGTTDFIKDSGTVVITVTVTDTRGKTSTPWTTNISVLPWVPPQITTISAERALSNGVVDPAGTYLKVTLIGSVSSLLVGSEKNTLTYKTDTSIAGANTWTNKRNTAAGSVTTINTTYVISSYVETNTFDVKTQLIDRFSTTTVIRNVTVAGIALDLGLTNVGVGKFWQRGTLDVGGVGYSSGGFYSDSSITVTNWNDATLIGAYNSAAGATNAPFTGYAFMGRNYAYGSWLMQEVIPVTAIRSPLRISRMYNGTTWTNWLRSDGLMILGTSVNSTLDPLSGRWNLTSGSKLWNFNNVFTSDYRRYRVDYSYHTGDDNGLIMRARKAGSDISSSDYYSHVIYSNNTTPSATGNPAIGYLPIAGNVTFGHFGYIHVSEVMYTAGAQNRKRFDWHDSHGAGFGNTLGSGWLNNNNTESIDGFTLALSNSGINGLHADSHSWISITGLE